MFEIKKKSISSQLFVEEGIGDIHDVAIIGMAARLPGAMDYREFWQILENQIDCYGEFPASRAKDMTELLKNLGQRKGDIKYATGAYMENIDEFDHNFFRISSKEASLMDPNQRLFLETAWHCIQDAGYGENIVGTNTGVYLGYSGTSDYQRMIAGLHPELLVLSEAGNINSIIASRIAYMLDWHGPSMIVDTACSSALTAIAEAVAALRNKKCDMALTGSVKILLAPVEREEKLGIESSSGKTKTFDDASDGTVLGEGAVAFLLKPLEQARKDGDRIHAVIKGYAVNQDGKASGITVPNLRAQEQLLENAWKDAGIRPETVTYVEAHGTGTTLGDPIEVKALSNALSKHTARRSFCAISSAKSVVGHLDHAAGAVGVLRAIFALREKKIPASLHFSYPNRKIDFISGPVYVNDQVEHWRPDCSVRRCGVSAFGLSGTNCHIILEEVPEPVRKSTYAMHNMQLAVLSAKSWKALVQILQQLYDRMPELSKQDFGGFCASLAQGQFHHPIRAAVLAWDFQDFKSKLVYLIQQGTYEDFSHPYIWVGECVPEAEGSVMQEMVADNGSLPVDTLSKIAKDYTNGSAIAWRMLFPGRGQTKGETFLYPFDRKKCWLKPSGKSSARQQQEVRVHLHPLVHELVAQSRYLSIYRSDLDKNGIWVLGEHKVLDAYLMPGTGYIEMMRYCAQDFLKMNQQTLDMTGAAGITFRDIIFLTPLAVYGDEIKVVQIVLTQKGEELDVEIISRNARTGKWDVHCQTRAFFQGEIGTKAIVLDEIAARCQESLERYIDYFQKDAGEKLHFGRRWGSLLQSVAVGKEEVIAKFSLPEDYSGDLKEYFLHPSLFDVAINVVTQATGNGLYLPLSYGELKINGPLPENIYSYLKRKGSGNEEAVCFDALITDDKGNVLLEATDYTIKKVGKTSLQDTGNFFYRLVWEESGHLLQKKNWTAIDVLITNDSIVSASDDRPVCDCSSEDFAARFASILIGRENQDTVAVCLMTSNGMGGEPGEMNENPLEIARKIVRAVSYSGYAAGLKLYFVTRNGFSVTGDEPEINPYYAAVTGYGISAMKEIPNLKVLCLDVDHLAKYRQIEEIINFYEWPYRLAVRGEAMYMESFDKYLIVQKDNGFEWKSNGIYIITGGLGGIGKLLAGQMLSHGVRILLLSRGKQSGEEDPELAELCHIASRNGGELEIVLADVSEETMMREVLARARMKYGKILGVIHGAGVPDHSFIHNKTKEDALEVQNPKVKGTLLLDELTREDNLQFFVLFSSVSSFLGEPGQADYTASNAFLDAFYYVRKRRGDPVLCINWSAWENTGITTRFQVKDGLFYRLKQEQAISLFFKLLESETDQPVITGLLNHKVATELAASSPFTIKVDLAYEKTGIATGRISETPSATDGGTTLDRMKEIWKNLFDTDEIDINMSFSDMGGDSIMATYLLKEINQVFPDPIDIASVFNYPTVASLSEYMDGRKQKLIKSECQHNGKAMEKQKSIDDLITGLQDGTISVNQAMSQFDCQQAN